MHRLSGLYRSIVPWHGATAWALVSSSIVFLSTWYSHGFNSGVRGGIAVFIAWAIVRELAPRRFWPSLLAPFATTPFAIPADTDLLACVGVLFAVRISARTTGSAITTLDSMVLAIVVWLMVVHAPGLPIALVLSAAVFAARPRGIRMRLTGIVLLAAALVTGVLEGTVTPRPELIELNEAKVVLSVLCAVAAVWLCVAPLPRRLSVRDDRDARHLRGSALRAGRVVAVCCLLAVLVWCGSPAPFLLSSLSGALVASAIGGARARDASASGTLRA